MFTGQKIKLTELNPDNSEKIRKIRNNPLIFNNFNQYKLITQDNHKKWFSKINDSLTHIYFEIHTIDSNELIGQCGLLDINWISRNSDFSIYIDPDHYGKGYGKDALSVLLNYAFNVLNLARIFSHVFDFNKNAISLYQKFNFVIEGTLRNHHFHNGEYINVIIIGLLKKDFDLIN